MITLFIRRDESMVAKGLTPGECLQVHLPNGNVYNVTRFGSDCFVRKGECDDNTHLDQGSR
jgi:hypothetical protein